MSNKRIMAVVKGNHTEFRREVDVTEAVLGMHLDNIRKLEDDDMFSDELAPDSVVNSAKDLFTERWGQGNSKVRFGVKVEVVESICEYFGVKSLRDIKRKPSKNEPSELPLT